MRPWELEDGITPSCAPLTWGSLECRRFAAFCGCAAGLLRLSPQGSGMSELSHLWHSCFKRGIYEADDFVSCLPTAKAVGYASTAPMGLNRRTYCITYPQKRICCG